MIRYSNGFIKTPPPWGNMGDKYDVYLLNLAWYTENTQEKLAIIICFGEVILFGTLQKPQTYIHLILVLLTLSYHTKLHIKRRLRGCGTDRYQGSSLWCIIFWKPQALLKLPRLFWSYFLYLIRKKFLLKCIAGEPITKLTNAQVFYSYLNTKNKVWSNLCTLG